MSAEAPASGEGRPEPPPRPPLPPLSPADRARLLFAPEEVLGAFSDLPAAARDALRDWVEGRDAAVMRGYEGRLGRWHGRLLRLVAGAAARARSWPGPARAAGRRLDRGLRTLMSALRRTPELLGDAGHRVVHGLRARLPGARPGGVAGRLARSGVSPHALAVAYARPLAQRPRFRAFWRDAGAHRAVGCIVGLDLCPSTDGWYVVESNLEPALSPERARIHDRDPVVDRLVEHAAARGYRHLVVMDSRFSGVVPFMAEQYRRKADEEGIRVRLVERVFVPRTGRERSHGIPPDLPPDTLVARLKAYPVATDHLLNDKIGSHRALALHAEAADEPDLRVPAAGPEPVLADHDPGGPFPNVVMKRADVDKGRAVVFAKARSPAHAREIFGRVDASAGALLRERLVGALRGPRHVFQAYVRPILLEGRRPYKVRALVLVSPDGPVFLTGYRVVSHVRVPERLPPGLVENAHPFMVSRSAGGGHYEPCPARELEGVRRATLAAGRGFARALRESFRWRPGQEQGAARS